MPIIHAERKRHGLVRKTCEAAAPHESIETTLRYYVGANAQRPNDAIWAAFRREQERLSAESSDFSSDLAPSGGADAAPPEKRPVLENTERNPTRPGVIRTHDQGIMSGEEPEE